MLDAGRQGLGILHQQLQVFGGEAVAELGGRLQAVALHDQAPVADGGPGDLRPGVARQLPLQGGRYRLGQVLAGGEQDGGGQGVVFRLGQQIRRHLVGLGGVVGDHQHLAGAGQGVDRHPAVHHLLGQGHVEIARPTDHIHPGDALGAIGQGRHRLGAAHPVDLIHPGQVGGSQHGGVGSALGTRGRDHHQPLHPGHLGRHRIHQHRAGVGGPATGHVQASPLHRPPAAPQLFAMGAFQVQIGGELALVKGQDPPVGQLQGLAQPGVAGLPGSF